MRRVKIRSTKAIMGSKRHRKAAKIGLPKLPNSTEKRHTRRDMEKIGKLSPTWASKGTQKGGQRQGKGKAKVR